MQGQTFNNSEAKEDVATTIERETNWMRVEIKFSNIL